uniref:MJ1316 domain-containing protein n=1 Tax=Strongyloides venezuelensis TaxID=75913 RepID=A0A0K0FMT2_STRVS
MKYLIFADLTVFDDNAPGLVDSISDFVNSLKDFRHTTEQVNLADIDGNLSIYFEELSTKCEFNLIEGIFMCSSTSKFLDEIDIKKIPFPSYFVFYDKDYSSKNIKSKTDDVLFLWRKRYFIDNHTLSVQISKNVSGFIECIHNIKNFICQTEDLFLAGHPDFSIWFECTPKIPSYISSILWGVSEGINDRYTNSCFDEPPIEKEKSVLDNNSTNEIKSEVMEQDDNKLNDNDKPSDVTNLDTFFWKVPETKKENSENIEMFSNSYNSNMNNLHKSKKMNKWDIKNISTVKTKIADLFEEKQGELVKVKEHFIPLHSKKPFPLYGADVNYDMHLPELNGLISHHLEIISFGPVNQILNIRVFQPRFELKCKKLPNEDGENKGLSNQTYYDSLGEVLFSKKVVMYFKHVASGEYGFVQATKLFNDEIRMYASFFDYNNKKFVLNGKPIEHTVEHSDRNAVWGTSNVQNYERQCWLTISSFRNECYKIYRFLLNSEKAVKLKNYIKLMRDHARIIGMMDEYNKFLKEMVSSVLPEDSNNLPTDHYNLLKSLSSEGIYSPEID